MIYLHKNKDIYISDVLANSGFTQDRWWVSTVGFLSKNNCQVCQTIDFLFVPIRLCVIVCINVFMFVFARVYVCVNLSESLSLTLRNWKHELNIFQSALSCLSIIWSVFTMRQDFNSLLCSARPLKSSWLWRASLLRQETQYRWRYIKSPPVCSVYITFVGCLR